jgi:hypothetical protein
MRQVSLCIVTIATLLMLAGVPTRRVAADGPTAESPTFSQGDEWRFSSGAVLRVEAVEGDQVITTIEFPGSRCPGCRQYRDKNFTVVKVVDKNGSAVTADPFLGIQPLDFPLTVGKTWENNVSSPMISTGQMVPFENHFKVESYGDVKTKAGTFKAFKISWQQENRGTSRWTGNATLWYGPEVRGIVKREVHTSGWFPDNELASYTLK